VIRENRELRLATEFVLATDCNIFLTGKAGTGKTTFLNSLKSGCDKRMVVTAPTGVAAINAGGVTLHSFFQLSFGPFVPGGEQKRFFRFSRDKRELIKGLDLLVIDEISMVRADLLDGVDDVLRRLRRTSLPFGGVQLLLIGDMHQLPPVVKANEWQVLAPLYDSPYFFSSKALRKTELIPIELQHIYRQSDDTFIDLLNRVRDNNLDGEHLNRLNARHQPDRAAKTVRQSGTITLCTHNNRAESINKKRLASLSTAGHIFSATIEGDFPEHAYPTEQTLELKAGAQVMFVRNDPSPEKLYFNGKIGQIVQLDETRIRVRCQGDEEEIVVEPLSWDNVQFTLDSESMQVRENSVGTFTQVPLKLAWAITIHKSQGLTFDQVVIDAQAAFAPGQVYVALSRCRSLDGLVLSTPLDRRGISLDPAVLRFTSEIASRQPTMEALAAAKISYQQKLILDCFDYTRLGSLVGRLVSTVRRYRDLLHLQGIDDLDALHQNVLTEICAVGRNFCTQLRGLFREDLLPAQDPAVLERLHKASGYFTEKIATHLDQRLDRFSAETDNKEVRKQVRDLLANLRQEIHTKALTSACCATGFDNGDYLRACAAGAVMVEKPEKKRETVVDESSEQVHQELFDSLREWRTKQAAVEDVAAYRILHQKVLIQIAAHLPASLGALKKIKGIGPKIAEKYGDELLALILAYRNKHGIEQQVEGVHEELVERDGEENSQKKQAAAGDSRRKSLALHAQGLSATEIASERGLALTTIETHLVQCLAAGDIELDELVDRRRQQIIADAIEKAQSERLKPIKEILGEDFSYGEIRYVMAGQPSGPAREDREE
jgi:hypothetical protein